MSALGRISAGRRTLKRAARLRLLGFIASLVVKPFERAELFRSPQFCFLDRRFQHLNGLVVHGSGTGNGYRSWSPCREYCGCAVARLLKQPNKLMAKLNTLLVSSKVNR